MSDGRISYEGEADELILGLTRKHLYLVGPTPQGYEVRGWRDLAAALPSGEPSRPGSAPPDADLWLAADVLVRMLNGHRLNVTPDEVRALAHRLRLRARSPASGAAPSGEPSAPPDAPCHFRAFGRYPCEKPEGHDGDHVWHTDSGADAHLLRDALTLIQRHHAVNIMQHLSLLEECPVCSDFGDSPQILDRIHAALRAGASVPASPNA